MTTDLNIAASVSRLSFQIVEPTSQGEQRKPLHSNAIIAKGGTQANIVLQHDSTPLTGGAAPTKLLLLDNAATRCCYCAAGLQLLQGICCRSSAQHLPESMQEQHRQRIPQHNLTNKA